MSPQMKTGAAMVAALLAAATAVEAQQTDGRASSGLPEDGRVVGVLIDETSRVPVSGALVFLSDGRMTETDGKGRFAFTQVRPGTHQIAAVTRGCGLVEGGFDVESGEDALLRLEVSLPQTKVEREARQRGTAATIIGSEELSQNPDRTVLEMIERHSAGIVEGSGSGARLRSRGASAARPEEPLLILDGTRIDGRIAQVLAGIKAGDVSRVEIHRGKAASWQYGFNVSGVIIVESRGSTLQDPQRPPSECVDWASR